MRDLLARGISADEPFLRTKLEEVSYFRLSAYWAPFESGDGRFLPGTQFATIWDRYVFDRELRLIILDALERIEVSVRARLTRLHIEEFGDTGYVTNLNSLPGLPAATRRNLMSRMEDETRRSHEPFVQSFQRATPNQPIPLWMANEIMSFGTVVRLFSGCPTRIKNAISSTHGVPHLVFESWLLALNTLRNACAHHARVWNREFGTKPKIPRIEHHPDWHHPVTISQRGVFPLLTLCHYLLKTIAPGNHWGARLVALFTRHPEIPSRAMGFPDNWRDSPLWAGAR